MSAIRHELSAQGALIAEEEYFDARLGVNFAEDAALIHRQTGSLREAEICRFRPNPQP